MTAIPEELDRLAARLAVDASILMNQALRQSGESQRELASRIGVSEARVSQLLNGDGNVRMSTLARTLGALGYEVSLTPIARTTDAPDLVLQAPRKRIRRADGQSPREPRGLPISVPEPLRARPVLVTR